ncbi:MAG: hypothetical protein HQM10_19200 [Candidatus Riflebacteria bacterium]|nr:hypothetical protein [Candidatus Riflebacteria bacterium]
MSRKLLALVIPFVSIIGILLVCSIGYIEIPKFFIEKALLEKARISVAKKNENLSFVLSKIQSIEQKGENIIQRLSKPLNDLASAAFPMPLENSISEFYGAFEEAFDVFDVKRIEFAYLPRVVDKGCITIPFTAKLFGPYSRIKNILEELENWQNPLVLNEVEFVNFSDDRGKIIVRFSGAVRFKAGK